MDEQNLSLLSDKELVDLTREGTEDAFGELWKRYYGAAKARAWVLVNHSDVDDVVSEAFLKTLEAIRRGKGPMDSFRPYLYVAIRSCATTRNSRPIESALEDASYGEATVEAAVIESADRDLINQAFYAMEPRSRKILWLWAADGMPAREIATEMGLGARHVSTLLDRARKSFLKNWAQAHVNCDNVEPGTEHAWVLGHLGQVIVKQAPPTVQQRVDAHLETCADCRAVCEEVSQMWTKFGSALVASVAGVALTGLSAAPEALALEQDIIQPPDPPKSLGGGGSGKGGSGKGHTALKRTGLPLAGVVLVLVLLGLQMPWASTPEMESAPSPAPVATTPGWTPSPEPSAAPSVPVETPAPVVPDTPDAPAVPAAPARPGEKRIEASTKPAGAKPERPAIVITAVDAGAGEVCYPVVSGTALAGSTVVLGGAGEDATVRVDAAGRWSAGPLTGLAAGSRTVVAEDPAGAQDAAVGRVVLTPPPTLSVTRSGERIYIVVRGLPGMPVAILVDDAVTGGLTPGADGQASAWQALAEGPHRIGVRYDPGGCQGPVTAIAVG